ncbi:helix-turn-helix domain-containing protein [Nitrospirillum amazonense]|nr:helix-turn-helix transcriptional regulator [Nitrospirillum amazonense]
MDLMETVSRNLRRLRHEKGLSQEELAGRAEISARYLGDLERGQYSCTVTVLGQLANGLGVHPADFFA